MLFVTSRSGTVRTKSEYYLIDMGCKTTLKLNESVTYWLESWREARLSWCLLPTILFLYWGHVSIVLEDKEIINIWILIHILRKS